MIYSPVRVQRYHLSVAKWRGGVTRVAMLADPHVGLPLMPISRLEDIVETINRLKPDLTVLLGDYRARYLYRTTAIPLDLVARTLTKLRAPLGVYGILGNHDWWDDKPTMRRGHGPCVTQTVFEHHGIAMLENAATVIDGRFNLIGLGDQWAFKVAGGYRGADDLSRAMAETDPTLPNILLAHEPDIFPSLPETIDLTLSGHTHGGQVVMNNRPVFNVASVGGKYFYGHYHEAGKQLVVSAGLGTSVAPVRIGRPAEITVIELGGY